MSKQNTEAKRKLIILYGCRDMLTLIYNPELEFHHLLKKEHGGKANVENGALMEDFAHDWLHSLENSDPELYDLINECMILYKKCLDLNKKNLIDQYQKTVAPKAKALIKQKAIESNSTQKFS